MIRESQIFINNSTLDFFLVPRVERRQSCYKFIKESSQSVEIDSIRMPCFLDHFRRHVLSAAAKTVSDIPAVESHFGQTEVCNFNMSVMVNQQILRFEISIDDILLMQVHKTVQYFDEVESSMFFRHSFDGLQIVEQLSSRTIYVKEYVQSNTKQTKLWVQKQWFSLTMKGWLRRDIIAFSFSMMFSFWLSLMKRLSMTFIAQNWPSRRLRTRQTLLKPPMARHLQTLYFLRRPSGTYSKQLKDVFRVSTPCPIEIWQSNKTS